MYLVPESTSVHKYYSIHFFSRKTIISCFRNFKVMFHCLPSPSIKNSSDSMTAWKSATKVLRKWKKKSIYSSASLDGPSGCCFATKLQENLFCKRYFCFSYKRMFCYSWTFVFFNGFFRKKAHFFKKKEREVSIIYKQQKNCCESFFESTCGGVLNSKF